MSLRASRRGRRSWNTSSPSWTPHLGAAKFASGLHEIETRPAKPTQGQPRQSYTLKHHDFQKTYVARLWNDGRQVRFQEDGTGILVTAEMPQHARPRECFQQRDFLLLKGMAVERAKARSSATQRKRAKRQQAIVPVTARDLTVRRTVNNGKLFYSWSAEQKAALTSS